MEGAGTQMHPWPPLPTRRYIPGTEPQTLTLSSPYPLSKGWLECMVSIGYPQSTLK